MNNTLNNVKIKGKILQSVQKAVILSGNMALNQSFIQEQKQGQVQKMTTNQVQFMLLLEKPLAQIEECVENELNDNIALVKDSSAEGDFEPNSNSDSDFDSDSNANSVSDADSNVNVNGVAGSENEPKEDDAEFSSGLLDDPDDEYRPRLETSPDDGTTLYQELSEQIQMLDITDEETELMEYIVGQLDNNGWLPKTPLLMSEELLLFQGKDVAPEELQKLINMLKTLDPAGIGAANLQDCLLVQVERRKKSAVTAMMKRILRDYFPDFINQKWKKLYTRINEDEELISEALQKIRKLNPRPGAGLGENVNIPAQQIVPDFIVETNGNEVTFSLNYGKIPRLAVDSDWDDLVKKFEGVDREKIRKSQYEEYMWKRNRVKKAKAFIQLLQLRFHTLYLTMKIIVDRQKQFFLSGDDNNLKPLLLKDVAAEMKYDISTISRACQSKYVQTEWGIYPMKHFFLISYGEGDDQYTLKQIQSAMQEIIDNEDKQHPLSDEKISELMKAKGFDLARRTIAKHRENMGIPVKRLRKV